ncbi:winged helix-turn-helix domain-containing protein [Microcoleus sp. Pol12A5]|uniref:winged helix-turn-helix domain-containing protein n=1 Tax=Microcoleus sp. Pol12A5 TaxID=3055392 RepID=UPI002FD048B8
MPTCMTDPVLPLIVDTAAPITIGEQITEQLKLLIARGNLKPNQPLPPITHLAKYLGVNHNTVAQVYNELIALGYLVGNRGKRTVIADTPFIRQMVARKTFYDLLSQAFHSASQYGLRAAEFSAAAYAQAVLAERHQVNVAFVNFYPDSIDISACLESATGLGMVSIPWAHLEAREPHALSQLLSADLIVTTIKNLWDVAQIADPNKEVIGIEVQPNMQLLSCISSLPRNAKVLFVCHEQSSSEAMKQIIDYNVHHIESQAVTLEFVQNNVAALQEFDLVVCSSQVENQLSRYIPKTLKLMIFSIGIDQVNLLVLQTRLIAVEMEKVM